MYKRISVDLFAFLNIQFYPHYFLKRLCFFLMCVSGFFRKVRCPYVHMCVDLCLGFNSIPLNIMFFVILIVVFFVMTMCCLVGNYFRVLKSEDTGVYGQIFSRYWIQMHCNRNGLWGRMVTKFTGCNSTRICLIHKEMALREDTA